MLFVLVGRDGSAMVDFFAFSDESRLTRGPALRWPMPPGVPGSPHAPVAAAAPRGWARRLQHRARSHVPLQLHGDKPTTRTNTPPPVALRPRLTRLEPFRRFLVAVRETQECASVTSQLLLHPTHLGYVLQFSASALPPCAREQTDRRVDGQARGERPRHPKHLLLCKLARRRTAQLPELARVLLT